MCAPIGCFLVMCFCRAVTTKSVAGSREALSALIPMRPFTSAITVSSSLLTKALGLPDLISRRLAAIRAVGPVVLLDVSNYRKLEIRRHANIAKHCQTSGGRYDIEDELIEYLTSENGAEYSALVALSKAVPNVPSVIVLPILSAVAWFQTEPIKVVPGMFCSQLVASALGELGAYPLRNDWLGRRIPPEKISPNRLRYD